MFAKLFEFETSSLSLTIHFSTMSHNNNNDSKETSSLKEDETSIKEYIKNLKQDMKKELKVLIGTLAQEMKSDMKQELNNLKHELSQELERDMATKFTTLGTDIKQELNSISNLLQRVESKVGITYEMAFRNHAK